MFQDDYVSRGDAIKAIESFVKSVPDNKHDIKIITIVLMSHGEEGD